MAGFTWSGKIDELIDKYSYKLDADHFIMLMNIGLSHNKVDRVKEIYPITQRFYYEMAGMLELLFKAKKDNTRISMKSLTGMEKIEINHSESINALWEAIFLKNYEYRYESYMYHFGWEKRDLVLREEFEKIKLDCTEAEWNSFFEHINSSLQNSSLQLYIVKPYDEDEIGQILKYEKSQMEAYKKYMNKRHSYNLNKLVKTFIKDGIFEAGKNKGAKESISMKDASFLYDCLCLFDGIEVSDILSKKDKYDYIRQELKKYQTKDFIDIKGL